MKTNQQKITLSQAISGFLLNIQGRRLSIHTVQDYTNTMKKFQVFLGNPLVQDIEPSDISAFIAAQPVSKKTALNYHTGLSSMFKWLALQGFVSGNILTLVERPKPEKRVIVPLEEPEVKALLAALDRSKTYSRPGKRTSDHAIINADRNRAILLFFLDNGVRVSELTNIKIGDIDVKNSRCYIMGKGAKERHVPFSARTGQVIWRYLTLRGDTDPDNYLFITRGNRPMTNRLVERVLNGAAERAGVKDVHPHRLRHTFAIMFIRAGGDPFSLQAILGHEDLEMSRHYTEIAQSDVKRVHKRASPVEFMRL